MRTGNVRTYADGPGAAGPRLLTRIEVRSCTVSASFYTKTSPFNKSFALRCMAVTLHVHLKFAQH